ncbi:hypothetical protein BKA69DRAFT_1098050, partial [Paraphysoderma sedebokerense]
MYIICDCHQTKMRDIICAKKGMKQSTQIDKFWDFLANIYRLEHVDLHVQSRPSV